MVFATAVGFIIGFLFGMSAITTLLGLMGDILIEVEETLRNIGVVSTLVLLIIAIVLVIKIKAVAGLIAGAIVGAVLNLILAQYGINVFEILKSTFGF
ncbi:MAG: hypothetical protein N3D09_02130 [Archaeoglobaceae archaeon]|nr:hypothetical protein [Archaeoglobaceae archaeon]